MTLLVLHGLAGNEAEHWQTWLVEQARLEGVEVSYPDLPDPDEPTAPSWLAAVAAVVGDIDVGSLDVVAHSLGCHLWAHLVDALSGRSPRARLARRVLLVAPPGVPEVIEHIPSFEPARLDGRLLRACPQTTLVLGGGDPWLADAEPLRRGLPVRTVADGRHLNVEAGYGPWPEMLSWVGGADPPGQP